MKLNIGYNLKALRKKYNLTQSQLATKLNISRQRLANYELEKREPDLITLIKISSFFNCSIEELILKNSDLKDLTLNKELNFENESLLTKLKKEKEFLIIKKKKFMNELLKLKKFINEELPKKIKEVDELIEFLENKEIDISEKVNADPKTNTKNLNKEFEKNKKDTEIGEEICIDFETKKQEKPKKEYVKIPVYNLSISAGTPLFSENAVVDEQRNLELKKPLTKKNLEEFFILKVDGDSMNNIVDAGEEILIRGTNYVNNGEIAVVTVLKDSVASTLKHYYKIGDEVLLKPNSSNPKHHVQQYNLRDEDVLVQGKYIGKVKDFLED